MFSFCFINISGGFQGTFHKIHRPGRNVVNFPISQVVTPTLFAQKTIPFQMEGPTTEKKKQHKKQQRNDKTMSVKVSWMVI